MLSKVIKGAGARQATAMVFAAATPPANYLSQPSSPPGSSAGPDGATDRSTLAAKLLALETGAAAAKRAAFDAGYLEGEQKANAALLPVLARMNAAISGLVNMRPDLRRRAEKDAVELSLQIARRVLHRELSVDGNALNALARVVFDRLARTETWQLTVHPQFAEAIRAALPAGSATRVRIDADSSCETGTVIVRCGEGVIDASVDSQLAEISHGLTDRLNRK